jgi:hypothetical protein
MLDQIVAGIKALAVWITGTAIPAVKDFCDLLDDIGGAGASVKVILAGIAVLEFSGVIASVIALGAALGPVALAATALIATLTAVHEIRADEGTTPEKKRNAFEKIGYSMGDSINSIFDYLSAPGGKRGNLGVEFGEKWYMPMRVVRTGGRPSGEYDASPAAQAANSRRAAMQDQFRQDVNVNVEILDRTGQGVSARYTGNGAATAQ